MDQKLGMVSQLELYAEELPAQLDMAIPASSAGSAGSAGTLSTPFSSAATAGTASSAG